MLHALQSRLEEGRSVLQRTDALHARKHSLIMSSLRLLGTHCSRTYDNASNQGRAVQEAAGGAAESSSPSQDTAGMPPGPPASPTGVMLRRQSRHGDAAVTCTSLNLQWQAPGRGVLTAGLVPSGGSWRGDLSGAQLLVSSAQLPLRVSPTPHAAAGQPGPGSAAGQAAAVHVRAALSVDGLPIAMSEPVFLDVFAVLPQLEQPQQAAAVAGSCAEPSTSMPGRMDILRSSENLPGGLVQRLGSVRLTCQDMLGSVSSSSADEQPRQGMEMRLVLEAAGAHSVTEVPQALRDSLGLQLEWQTGVVLQHVHIG